MNETDELLLVFPEVDDDLVSNLMIALTRQIDKAGKEIAIQGFLGGEHGYGAHFSNSVFTMRPFYWGDCECDYDTKSNEWENKHPHSQDCYQTIFRAQHYKDYPNSYDHAEGHEDFRTDNCTEALCKQFGIDPQAPGAYVHCTCRKTAAYRAFVDTIQHSDNCQMDKPNFEHHETGLTVDWYKYIGRSMEYPEATPEEWLKVFRDCISSLKVRA